jgi:hypothetical protein
MKPAVAGALVLIACFLTGCATTLRGTTDVLIVDSDPTGARVSVSSGLSGTTPATFTLRRKGDYVVTVTKDGFEAVSVNVTHKIVGAGSAGMAGNILLGGIIGAAVDAGSGAMFDLVPNPINVKLVPQSRQSVVADAASPSVPIPPRAEPSRPPHVVRTFTPSDITAAAATIEAMQNVSAALRQYVKANGHLPPGKTITDIYPALARIQPVRIADYWGNPFAFGATPEGFVIASAGADGQFDDETWNSAGQQGDLDEDAVLRVTGDSETFVRKWY